MKKFLTFAILLATGLAAFAIPRISLLTALPGEEIFTLEGHSALRIYEQETNQDITINWGVFDFNSPNFAYRFAAGETDYLCAAEPTGRFIQSYVYGGRKVIEQVLTLDSLQTAELLSMVTHNLMPENRVYRYNYVKDNCATRPLAFIEAAIGHKLLSDKDSGTTFRNEMRRFHKDYPWYQFSIDLALGRGIDREISERETAFAPVTLMQLLKETDIVSETIEYGQQSIKPTPTPWYATPLFISIVILCISIISCKFKRSEWVDTVLFGSFFIGGCVLTFLVFISSHEATLPNLLLLWLNPLCLLGAILPWIKKAKKAIISYFFVNFALLILLAVLVLLLGRGMNVAFWPLIAADAVRSVVNIQRCKKRLSHSQ